MHLGQSFRPFEVTWAFVRTIETEHRSQAIAQSPHSGTPVSLQNVMLGFASHALHFIAAIAQHP